MLRGQLTRLNHNLVRFVNRPAHPIRKPRVAAMVEAAVGQEDQPPADQMPALEPAAMEIEPEQEASPDLPLIAKLSKCPRSLHELWKEYEFGSGGFKATKDFTEREKGGRMRASITGGIYFVRRSVT